MPVITALPPLLALAALIVAYGLIVFGSVFVQALFQVANKSVGWVPWLGSKVTGSLHSIEKRLNHAMGTAAAGVSAAIAASWHSLAYLVEQTGAAIWDVTRLAAHVYWLVEVKYPLRLIEAAAHRATKLVHTTTNISTHVVKRVTIQQGINAKQWRNVWRKLGYLSVVVAALQHAHAHAPSIPLPGAIPWAKPFAGLRGRVGRLERRFGRKAFLAAVAGALATLGLTWARKPCAKRTADGWCGVNPDVFEALIGSLAVLVGAQSVVRFANGCIAVEDEMVGVLERMIVELGDVTG